MTSSRRFCLETKIGATFLKGVAGRIETVTFFQYGAVLVNISVEGDFSFVDGIC